MLALIFRQSHVPPREFFPYVLAGYVLWGFIASTITSSTTVIQRQFDFAVHNQMSLPGLFFKLLIDRLLRFALDLTLVVGAVVLLEPETLGAHLLLVPVLLAIISLVSIAVSYTTNLMVILLPDLEGVTGVGVRFMFFVSPIFWSAEGSAGGARGMLVTYNPVTYYLSSFRQAFGIAPFDLHTWAVMLGISSAICTIGWFVYSSSAKFVVNLK